jgi:enoyl-CoA hydratase
MAFETLLIDRDPAGVGVITLNRPEAMNALNETLVRELDEALVAFEADDAIGCIVVTGAGRAFAAGADIKMMATKTFAEVLTENLFADADRLARCRKPTIAAVAGFALGGGCELAMMADMIIAADNAKFGQPEIKLGVIPGIGGTQRLVRAIGKAKAMDLCLTGRMMDAKEAEAAGLVARVVPAADLMAETLAAARTIAGFSRPSLMLCKEAVNAAFETSLAEGVRLERRAFHSLFATEDQKEGMAAFVGKRPAKFSHR